VAEGVNVEPAVASAELQLMRLHCLQVESELRKLAQVYAVYAEHAEAVRQFSNMLWSELDIGNMMDGVQAVATKLKKLKGLEDMPVFGLVQAEIAGFADSLPLMKELKSEALRCVHCSHHTQPTLLAASIPVLCTVGYSSSHPNFPA
jgi:hypothetical protein